MASSPAARVLKAGLLVGIGYLGYEAALHGTIGGPGSKAQNLALQIHDTFGGVQAPGVPGDTNTPTTPSAPTSNGSSGIGGGGVYTGTLSAIRAAAKAAGVLSAADPRADQYGAALWSLQSHQPQSAFGGLQLSDRATFDGYAITGTGN